MFLWSGSDCRYVVAVARHLEVRLTREQGRMIPTSVAAPGNGCRRAINTRRVGFSWVSVDRGDVGGCANADPLAQASTVCLQVVQEYR